MPAPSSTSATAGERTARPCMPVSAAWSVHSRLSRAGRTVFEWLPVHELTEAEVFRTIRAFRQRPFWIYTDPSAATGAYPACTASWPVGMTWSMVPTITLNFLPRYPAWRSIRGGPASPASPWPTGSPDPRHDSPCRSGRPQPLTTARSSRIPPHAPGRPQGSPAGSPGRRRTGPAHPTIPATAANQPSRPGRLP